MKTLNELALNIAQVDAHDAACGYIRKNGEHPFNCGFAWVVVKGIRGNKSKLLKELGFKKHYAGGLSLWNPSGHMTQDMSAKMAGAEVYAKALREMGLDAHADCRLD